MEQSIADLLSDAFSESDAPPFPDGDLDFENLNFDERSEEDTRDTFQENLLTKEDEALQQEATAQTAVMSSMKDDIEMSDSVAEEQCDDTSDDEDCESSVAMSRAETLEEDYTSSESEEEGSVSGEDEDEEDTGTREGPGDLLRSVRCGDEFCYGNKEDRIFAEGQPLAPQGAENPQVRNKEPGEGESDEEASYFERVPERGSEMMIKGDGIEEDEQDREEDKEEDSCECEGMKIEQEENVLCFEQELENPYRDRPVKASLEFPEISVQNLQDLVAEVDHEDYKEKMKDFSGEEHQEAGESFADYPSDLSSYEYVEDGGKNQESNQQERAVTDIPSMGRAEDTDEEGDGYLYSRDLDVEFRSPDVASGEEKIVEDVYGDAALTGSDDGGETGVYGDTALTGSDDRGETGVYGDAALRGSDEGGETGVYVDAALTGSDDRGETGVYGDAALTGSDDGGETGVYGDATLTGSDDGGETGESDSYSSSDDEVQEKRSNEELFDGMCAQGLESINKENYNRVDPADFNINWNPDLLTTDTLLSEDLLTTEDTDEAEIPLSDMNQHPAEDVNSYSVVERGDATATSPSNQGSLDDNFFFTTEPEASANTELGQLGDDEYEEERNWEQEQERIKAFYEFYDDSDKENEREGRQIKVQFCADPLSQVIHYETDSSDRDSVSSSTEGEEDVSSAETSEELREPDDTTQMTLTCDPPITQLPENVPDLSNTHICTKKQKCFSMLKLTLKMGLVILAGLLMFWFATDQEGWFSHVSFS